MLFRIVGKHFEISEPIRKYAEQKTSKLSRYYNSINKIEVVIEVSQNTNSIVEIIASAEHNKVFIAKEAGGDTYACIDLATRKLERQLTKKKEKERDNRHKHRDRLPEPEK